MSKLESKRVVFRNTSPTNPESQRGRLEVKGRDQKENRIKTICQERTLAEPEVLTMGKIPENRRPLRRRRLERKKDTSGDLKTGLKRIVLLARE